MGAGTLDTDTRSCPPAQWTAGLLSFPVVYGKPIMGMSYTFGKVLTLLFGRDDQNSCPLDFGLAAPL